MQRYGSEVKFTTVADTDDYAGGRRSVQQLYSSNFRPTAIIYVNDFMATGVLRQLRDMGIDVPGQVSVTGFDNVTLSEIIHPALTTAHPQGSYRPADFRQPDCPEDCCEGSARDRHYPGTGCPRIHRSRSGPRAGRVAARKKASPTTSDAPQVARFAVRTPW